MLFGQKTHPLNFEYGTMLSVADDHLQISGNSFVCRLFCDRITDFCTRLRFENAQVADQEQRSDGIVEQYRQGQRVSPKAAHEAVFDTGHGSIILGPAWLRVQIGDSILLQTIQDGIGFNGETLVLNFDVGKASGFYGFGERTKRFNKSGDSLDFWNVDVVAVFPHTYDRDDYDPTYVAIPWLILKTDKTFIGLYFDNPGRAIIDVERARPGVLMYQSFAGKTDVHIVSGPTLRDVVRHFTELTGRAEIPPLWSLGYHQSRWGYQTETDMLALMDDFKRYDIPVSAFWYDIDYMDEYRLFTWDRQDFPAPDRLNKTLKEHGIRTVTIVDPGVKLEPGYSIYDSGKHHDVYCKTLSGRDYVGRVWPGDTVFPDFTLESVRIWWAEILARFIQESRIDGVWLDMNDPATGFSAAEDMLFQHGRIAHDRYHNQYAHFMAKASLEAFDQLNSNERAFLLTRSAYTGTQRYSAVWTGDNVSSWQHLRMAVPCTLNLGLSGIAFNGPDVGGFMGHTHSELVVRWYQAGFLFPFFRNHSVRNSKAQEPWQFGPECLAYIRETIRTRYRLLPYLYTCFFEHYLTGDPVLRPLLYEYEDPAFENMDDQFLVGNALMLAPIVKSEDEGSTVVLSGRRCQLRYISLPEGWWFDLNRDVWIEGGKTITYAAGLNELPWFARDGAIIPYYNGPLANGLSNFNKVELHVFMKERTGQLGYFIDDQTTRRYRSGDYNSTHVDARIDEKRLEVTIRENGHYPVDTVNFCPVVYGQDTLSRRITIMNGKSYEDVLQPSVRQWLCKQIQVLA